MEVIKRLERKQGLFIPADGTTMGMIEVWDKIRQDTNSIDKEAGLLLRDILSRLGDAEGFDLGDGRKFKYAEQNGQRRCDLDALQRFFEAIDSCTYLPDGGGPMCDMNLLLEGYGSVLKAMDVYRTLVTQGTHRTPRIVGKAKGQ